MTDIAKLGIEVDSRQIREGEKALDGLTAAGGRAAKASELLGKAVGAAVGYFSVRAIVEFGKASLMAAAEAEQASLKMDAVLKATRHSAGMTKTSLDALADSMAKSTKYDDESIRNASAVLLTFRNVQNDTFTKGIKLAADLSAVLGSDLQSATLQVGKALNAPVEGITALSRAGVQFTAVQKAQIKEFVETNQLAKAQAIILKELEDQVGGTAEKMNSGITKATGDLRKAWGEFTEAVGKTDAVGGNANRFLSGMAGLLTRMKETIEAGTWTDKLAVIMQRGDGGPDWSGSVGGSESRLAREGAARQEAARSLEAEEALATKNAEALEKLAEADQDAAAAVRDHVAAMRLDTEQLGQNAIQQRMVSEAAYAATLGTAAQRMAVMEAAAAWAQKRAATDAATEAEKKATKAVEDTRIAQERATKTLDARIAAIEDETFAMTATAEQLREHIILRELEKSGIDASTTAYAAYAEKLRDAMQRNDAARETKKATDEQTRMWERLEETGRQTFVSWANGAKDFAQRAKESLKNILFDWLWQMTARKWILNVGASVTGASSAGAAIASPGGGIGGGGDIFSTLGNLSNMASSLPSASVAWSNLASSYSTFTTMMSDGASMIDAGRAALAGTSSSFASLSPYIGAALQLAQGNVSGAAFTAGGAFIGNLIVPGLGGVVGGAIGSVVGGMFGGGDDPHNNPQISGLNGVTIGAGGVSGGSSFVAGPTSGSGWWGESTQLTAAQIAAINTQVDAVFASGSAMASLLGVNAPLSGVSVSSATDGITNGKVAKYFESVDVAMSKLSDKIALTVLPTVANYQAVNETLGQALARVTWNLSRVRNSLGMINRSFDLSGDSAVKFSETLIAKFGGLDALGETLGTYYDTYFTEAEKTAKLTTQVSGALAMLGYNLPTTLEGFRAIVEAQDLTTESGQAAFESLMALSPAFAELVKGADSATAAWDTTATSIADTIKRIRGDFDDTSLSLAEAEAQFALATAAARAGDAAAAASLSDIAERVVELGTLMSDSRAGEELLTARVAASLETTLTMMGDVQTETADSLAIVATATGVANDAISGVVDAITTATTSTGTTATTSTGTTATTSTGTTAAWVGGGSGLFSFNFDPNALREKLIAAGYTPSFDIGTSYVPDDMLAQVHAGERITPRPYVDMEREARDETVRLLADIRREIAELRVDAHMDARSIAGHVAKSARIAERHDDGDAMSVRLVIASTDTPLPVV